MNAPQPMFSLESERCVIGALLMENNAIDFTDELRPEHFFIEDHRMLFTTIRWMILAKKGCDVITLAEQLIDREDGQNWLPILGEMVANTPTSKNVGRYARIVINRAIERTLTATAGQIVALASSQLSTEEKVDQSQALVMALADDSTSSEGRSIASLMSDAIDSIQDGVDGKIVRNLTGYADIDRRADLLTPGDLIIVAARPSMGKSTFVMNIAEYVAKDKVIDGEERAGMPVVVFSQEMSGKQLALKTIASLGKVDLEKLTRNQKEITTDEFDRIAFAVGTASDMKLFIDDRPARSPQQVRTYCRAIIRKHGKLGLVVIDYMQLMSGDGGSKDGRHEEIASISRGLKALAKELDVPVIALSQLSRKCEERPNKRPMMSDLRESGQLEQDADVIGFIYRDEFYNPDTPDKGIAEFNLSKVRMGIVGTVALAFNGNVSRFDTLCREWSPPETKAQAPRRGFK